MTVINPTNSNPRPLDPNPYLPPTQAPDGTLPSATYQVGGSRDPYADKLAQFIEYFSNVTTNDTTANVNFAQYITNLSMAIPQGQPTPGGGTSNGTYVPLLDDSNIVQMLNTAGPTTIGNMLGSALAQASEYEFYATAHKIEVNTPEESPGYFDFTDTVIGQA